MIISYKLFAFASIDNGNWLWVSIQGDRSSAQSVSIMYCIIVLCGVLLDQIHIFTFNLTSGLSMSGFLVQVRATSRSQNKLVERPLSCACGENTARNIQALLNVYCIFLSVPTVDTKTTQTDENPTDRHKTGPSRSLVRGRVMRPQLRGHSVTDIQLHVQIQIVTCVDIDSYMCRSRWWIQIIIFQHHPSVSIQCHNYRTEM